MSFLDDLLDVGNSDVVPQSWTGGFQKISLYLQARMTEPESIYVHTGRGSIIDIRRRNINNFDQLAGVLSFVYGQRIYICFG